MLQSGIFLFSVHVLTHPSVPSKEGMYSYFLSNSHSPHLRGMGICAIGAIRGFFLLGCGYAAPCSFAFLAIFVQIPLAPATIDASPSSSYHPKVSACLPSFTTQGVVVRSAVMSGHW